MRRQATNGPETGERRSVIKLVGSPLGRITGPGPTLWSRQVLLVLCMGDALRPLRTRQLEMLPQHRALVHRNNPSD